MDSVYLLIIIGTLASIYAGLASFPGSIAIISNFTTPTHEIINLKIPAILQEDDEITNSNLTSQVRIQPHEAILVAVKKVSALPSDVRSLSLQNESGHPVYSLDIFNSKNAGSVDIMINAIDGKILRIDKDLDYSGDGQVDGEAKPEEKQQQDIRHV